MVKDDLDELIERFAVEDPDLPAMAEGLAQARQMVRAMAELRERQGITQVEMAERMRTTQSAIARLERADTDPRLSTISKYLAVVGCRLTLASARDPGDDGR